MTLGKSIKKYRAKKGLTQKKLAELTGLSTGTIQQYELDKRQPTFANMKKISDVIDMGWIKVPRGQDEDPVILPSPTLDDVLEGMQNQVASNADAPPHMTPHVLTESEFILINYFKSCNYEGKDKIIKYAKDIVKIPEYQMDPAQDPGKEEQITG